MWESLHYHLRLLIVISFRSRWNEASYQLQIIKWSFYPTSIYSHINSLIYLFINFSFNGYLLKSISNSFISSEYNGILNIAYFICNKNNSKKQVKCRFKKANNGTHKLLSKHSYLFVMSFTKTFFFIFA